MGPGRWYGAENKQIGQVTGALYNSTTTLDEFYTNFLHILYVNLIIFLHNF